MTMIRIAGPTVLAVDLQTARLSLRVDGTDMDELIERWVKGIIGKLENEVGQQFMEQTWEVRLSCFPGFAGQIELPHPAMAVTSFKYLDHAGAEQTIAPEAYRLNVGRYASTLSPARGGSWPATAEDQSAVVVTVKCGYGNTPDKTPDTAQLFILGKLVEQYDPITRTERDTVQSVYLDGLVDDLRCYA